MNIINWHNIRPIHNSLNDGFEELVCQLASKETIKSQKLFQRIGRPDGGKECYWVLENGDMYMWQAKYFTTSLTTTQWTQIDKSIKTAIDNHPKLTKYCVSLPLDMPDGKTKGRNSMLDKWKAKVTEWQSYALTKVRHPKLRTKECELATKITLFFLQNLFQTDFDVFRLDTYSISAQALRQKGVSEPFF